MLFALVLRSEKLSNKVIHLKCQKSTNIRKHVSQQSINFRNPRYLSNNRSSEGITKTLD